MSTEAAKHKKMNLEWQARASLRKRIEDTDWDWDTAERYERHAINAILDLEEAEAVNKELLQALEKLRNEILAILGLARLEIVNKVGDTNYSVLRLRLDESEAAIAKTRGIR